MAIPILYRARKAESWATPFNSRIFQTFHVTGHHFFAEVGLQRVDDVRFAYTESSLYDLFAATRGVEPVFLGETYRSADEIAEYSNQLFYRGRLRIATDANRLTLPRGMAPGIHWTEVAGEVKSGGGSGCYCREEILEIDRIVQSRRGLD